LREASAAKLQLMLPQDEYAWNTGAPLNFSWVDVPNATLYRLEVEADGKSILSALVKPGVSQYAAPPWLAERAGKPLRWRVIALNQQGEIVARSDWRSIQMR
jgi:hypothetical protein